MLTAGTCAQVRIQKDGEVRLRIVGIRNDANEIVRLPCLWRSFLLHLRAD